MSVLEVFILKVQRRLRQPDIEEAKILKYLRELDKISIGINVLKTTGIGKTINGLRHRDETQIAELANNLVQKWKEQARKQSEEAKGVKLTQPTHHNSTADSKTVSNDDYQNKQQTNHQTEHKRYQSNLNKHSSATFNFVTNEEERKLKKLKQREKDKHENRGEHHNEKKKESSETRFKPATLQLCDVSFGCEVPAVSKNRKKISSSPASSPLKRSIDRSKPNHVSAALPPLPPLQTVENSLLPETQPNYRPNRIPDPTLLDAPGKKHKGLVSDVDYTIVSRNSRTQVFSGKRTANTCGKVLSLYDLSMKVLIENIDALQDTGGVPFDILKPVLERCSPQQLFQLEEYNPYFIDDSDPLWEKHCKREFKGAELEDPEQTWRELYMEKVDEREQKLKKINEKITAAQAAKKPERQVKLAYVMTEAKPPPQVRRKQARFGTGKGVASTEPPLRVTSHDKPSTSSSHRPSNLHSTKKSTGPAPMMKKTMKMLKSQRNVKTTQIRRH